MRTNVGTTLVLVAVLLAAPALAAGALEGVFFLAGACRGKCDTLHKLTQHTKQNKPKNKPKHSERHHHSLSAGAARQPGPGARLLDGAQAGEHDILGKT